MDLSKYDVSQATHDLKCRHCIGTHGLAYRMPCLIVNRTKSGSYRIVVFGDRYWKNKRHIKRVRYVPEWKLKERAVKEQCTAT